MGGNSTMAHARPELNIKR